MPKATHTPGPWCTGYDGHGGIRIVGDEGRRQVGYVSPCPDAEQKANAGLISAAPELLAALEMYVNNTGSVIRRDAALAAIRKAKGEADV